jgi:ParB/RepB/Spo0J family partition protein
MPSTATAEPPRAAQKPNGQSPEIIHRHKTALIVASPFNAAGREPDEEMLASVRAHGIIQPLLARPKDGTRIELIAGERRWKSALKLKLDEVPVIIRQANDTETIELQTIENEQRKDLSPIEQAEKYQQALDQYAKEGFSGEKGVERLAAKIGKGKSTIYEALKLVKLPHAVKKLVGENKLPPSHAALLGRIEDPQKQLQLARMIAPEKPNAKEVSAWEDEVGLFGEEVRDEKGVLNFRDTKEAVDTEVSLLAARKEWTAAAEKHRKAGGRVLTEDEITKHVSPYGKPCNGYVGADDWTYEYSNSGSGQEFKKLWGKHAPKPVLAHDRNYKVLKLYPKSEAIASIEKNGHKKKQTRSTSSSQPQSTGTEDKKRAERQAVARRIKPAADAAVKLVQGAAQKNKKFPWPIFFNWLSDVGTYIPQAKIKTAAKSEKSALAFLAQTIVDDTVENFPPWSEYESKWEPQFKALCDHYGVDLKKLEKELAPPPAKTKSQAFGSGKQKAKTKGKKK